MSQKVYKTAENLVIEIPLIKDRYNLYMGEEGPIGKMPNVVAVIEDDDMGFCYRIDMDYKGKDDQWTDFFFKWFGSQEGFEKLCEELGFDIVYYSSKVDDDKD